jgi:hypothetical protein
MKKLPRGSGMLMSLLKHLWVGGACLGTASTRSAGSKRGRGYLRGLLIDKNSSVNKSTLEKSTRRFEEGDRRGIITTIIDIVHILYSVQHLTYFR